jgi:hypothetical protein
MSQTAADVLVGVLQQIGVKQIFGLIGNTLNPRRRLESESTEIVEWRETGRAANRPTPSVILGVSPSDAASVVFDARNFLFHDDLRPCRDGRWRLGRQHLGLCFGNLCASNRHHGSRLYRSNRRAFRRRARRIRGLACRDGAKWR